MPAFFGFRALVSLCLLLLGSPTFSVALASLLAIRNRTDGGSDLDLLVPFDGWFCRSAAFFTPDERNLSADLGELVVDDPEGKHRAFVIAIAAESGQSN